MYRVAPRYGPSKITMALPLKAEHASETEDFESRRKVVKFAKKEPFTRSHHDF